jgi:tRNA A37 threonylcarbamoyladenosine dehydratase
MSCTDDHFTVDPEVAGRSTIWETIQTTSNLSQFADILKSVQYSKTRGTTTRQTYADLLNHEWCTSKAQINGSMSHITAIFGFTLAGLIIQDLYRR